MLKQGKFTFFVFLALGLALQGCGHSPGDPSQEGDLGSYVEQSCQFSTDDGDQGPGPAADLMTKGYFDKSYNLTWLRAVGHASIRQTMGYIRTTGANVYRGEAKSPQTCKNLAIAETMPWDVEREWDNANRSIDEESRRTGSGGFVAGLYLPAKRAIIVREDGSRWTLVHEFMHHNFKTQAEKEGLDEVKARAELNTLPSQVSRALRNDALSDREKVRIATPLFLRLSDSADQLLVQYPLEEITIEAMLQDQVDSGELTYVPTKSYANATWYINQSQAAVSSFYASMDDVYDSLRRLAASSEAWTEYRSLSRYLDLKSKRESQVIELVMRRNQSQQMRNRMVSAAMSAALDSTPAQGWMPCAEATEAFEMLKDITGKIAEATKNP